MATTISAEPTTILTAAPPPRRDGGDNNNHNNQRKSPIIVFLDISINDRMIGRIKIELFSDLVPKTSENFRQLCTGEFKGRGGSPIGYKGSPFHKIVPGFLIQGGDFIRGDGTGITSIYGDKFLDESSTSLTMLRHDSAGLVAMTNSGPNTNGCQFYITCAPCEFLNGKHVIFGKVIDGMNVVRIINEVPITTTADSKPKLPIIISECGEM